MTCDRSGSHWVGCNCVIEKMSRYRALLKNMGKVLTTLRFYAEGGHDGGCMAGLTLSAFEPDMSAALETEGQ